jgi:hypothetical protein
MSHEQGRRKDHKNFCEKSVGEVILNTVRLEEILNMDLWEMNCKDVNGIELAQDRT